MKAPRILLLAAVLLGLPLASGRAGVLVVNDNNAGSSSERGVAFNLTNTSAFDTVELTGLFNLAALGTASRTFDLWIRTGSVFNNIGLGAADWTSYGSATATAQNYSSPDFTLTTYSFTAAAGYLIEPGETIGIWLKVNDGSASLRYINGGSSTVTSTEGFTDGGLRYDGFYGLGSTGNAPNVANQLFGPTRNFIGEVGFTAVPEPSSYALCMAGVLLVMMVRRRLSLARSGDRPARG